MLLVSTDRLGDLIWTTPAIRLVRQACPDAQIVFLASRYAGSILANNPCIDQRWEVETRGGHALRRFRLIAQARRLPRVPFERAVQFNRWPENTLLLRALGVKDVHWSSIDPGTHFAQQRLDLVREAFDTAESGGAPELFPSDEDRATAARLLAQAGARAPFAVLHVSTHDALRRHAFAWLRGPRLAHKDWTEERYVHVATGLLEDGLQLVFTGSGSEGEAIRRLARALRPGASARIADLSGRTTPLQAAAVLERASLYLGPDTGMTHIAAAMRTPVIALHGPTAPGKSGPFRPLGPCRIFYDQVPCSPCDGAVRKACNDNICMKSLDAARVLAACREMLATRRVSAAPT